MSIFDRLSGLITDSLLCTRSNFRDYPITACMPTNKGPLCFSLIGLKSAGDAQRRGLSLRIIE